MTDKKPSAETMAVVEVRWLDSCGPDGWEPIKGPRTPMRIRSVGLLVEENDEGLTLSACAGEDNVHAPITIPWCAVLEWWDR